MSAQGIECEPVTGHIIYPHPDPEGSFFDTEPATAIPEELRRGVDAAFKLDLSESAFSVMEPKPDVGNLRPREESPRLSSRRAPSPDLHRHQSAPPIAPSCRP